MNSVTKLLMLAMVAGLTEAVHVRSRAIIQSTPESTTKKEGQKTDWVLISVVIAVICLCCVSIFVMYRCLNGKKEGEEEEDKE